MTGHSCAGSSRIQLAQPSIKSNGFKSKGFKMSEHTKTALVTGLATGEVVCAPGVEKFRFAVRCVKGQFGGFRGAVAAARVAVQR